MWRGSVSPVGTPPCVSRGPEERRSPGPDSLSEEAIRWLLSYFSWKRPHVDVFRNQTE